MNTPTTLGALFDEEEKKIDDAAEAKKKANAERTAKMRAAKEAKKASEAGQAAVEEAKPEKKAKPAPKEVKEVSPQDMVAIRTKTLADLQSAYAGGKHQEVLELLSRFGNGAKTFRELPPDAFLPIREAIDLGALT